MREADWIQKLLFRDVTRLVVHDLNGNGTHGFVIEPGSLYYEIQDTGKTVRVFCTSVQNAGSLHNVQNAPDP